MSDVLSKDGVTSERLPLDVGRFEQGLPLSLQTGCRLMSDVLSKDGVTSDRLPLDVGRFEQGWCHFRQVAA